MAGMTYSYIDTVLAFYRYLGFLVWLFVCLFFFSFFFSGGGGGGGGEGGRVVLTSLLSIVGYLSIVV